MNLHLTARRPPWTSLDRSQAAWLWAGLRRVAPTAHACVLMPDHLHLIAPVTDLDAARERLARTLQGFTRVFGGEGWTAARGVREIPDPRHLSRQVRYVVLNPCRSGLVRDPLEWLWTTHRDVVGAVVDPWVTADALADALERPRAGFTEKHHEYVSADPSVAVGGTPAPRIAEVVAASAGALLQAADAAQRYVAGRSPERARSGLFFALGRHVRWSVDALRPTLPTRRATAYARAAATPRNALAAAALCLSDDRLREPRRLPTRTFVPNPNARRPRGAPGETNVRRRPTPPRRALRWRS